MVLQIVMVNLKLQSGEFSGIRPENEDEEERRERRRERDWSPRYRRDRRSPPGIFKFWDTQCLDHRFIERRERDWLEKDRDRETRGADRCIFQWKC